jgi:beta-lactamase class A
LSFIKKIIATVIAAFLFIGISFAGLQYYDSHKSKATLEKLKTSSESYPDEKYFEEQIALIKQTAQEKRLERIKQEIEKKELEEKQNEQKNQPVKTPTNNSVDVEKIINSNLSTEEKIRSYLGTRVSKVGLGYYDISTGKGFSINGDKYYTAASTVKVQMNMVLFDMVKEGKVDINESLQYTQADYEAGTGILQGKDKSKPIPLLTLSDYSIIYSDNIATNMIIRRIGRTEMKKRFGQKLGHSVPMDKNSVTPNEGLAFLKMLYENKNDNSYYSRLIGIMKTTVFHDRLDKYVPKNIVAHKIGNYGAFVNDVGIVNAPKPYIIAIYTEGLPNANEVIANINKILYSEHK